MNIDIPETDLEEQSATKVPIKPPEATQSYNDCFEYCITAMDQAGQITDECSQECSEDTEAYTQDNIMDDDSNMGLIVSEQCLNECQTTSKEVKATEPCKQSCCVSSCELRQEYNGSGMGPECPKLCQEFLLRTEND